MLNYQRVRNASFSTKPCLLKGLQSSKSSKVWYPSNKMVTFEWRDLRNHLYKPAWANIVWFIPCFLPLWMGGSINYHGQSTTPNPPDTSHGVPSCALRMYPLRRLKGRGAQKRVIPLAVLSVNSGVSSNSGLPHGVSRLKRYKRCTGVRCMWLCMGKMMKNAEDKSSSAPDFHHQQPCTLRWLHQSTEDMAMYRMEMENFHALNFHIHTIFRALENATPPRVAVPVFVPAAFLRKFEVLDLLHQTIGMTNHP